MGNNIFKIHNSDARNINKILKKAIVDVTITSPPYFDLKDYNHPNQIGYGQKYEEYLNDLKKVFKNVYNVTKSTGTLWVIIDAFRKDGEVVPLPFDFSNKIRPLGWKLQEVIIWGKDRTVPWTHKGQMRSSFEYILVFSKTNDFKFNIDRVRDFETLKKWWIKYPERYNPKGKSPDAIWNFDIPTQGSWGNGYIRHFCPLPEEMIAQILKITTDEGGVVLDPFAGSGAVLAKADNMNRKFIGTELNEEYIKMFTDYLNQTGAQKKSDYEAKSKNSLDQNQFKNLILQLRALKFARLVNHSLQEKFINTILKVFVKINDEKPNKANSLIVVQIVLFVIKNCDKEQLANEFNEIIKKTPLSKFGVEGELCILQNISEFMEVLGDDKKYVYTDKTTHKFKKEFSISDLALGKKNEIIVSNIAVNVDEKSYE